MWDFWTCLLSQARIFKHVAVSCGSLKHGTIPVGILDTLLAHIIILNILLFSVEQFPKKMQTAFQRQQSRDVQPIDYAKPVEILQNLFRQWLQVVAGTSSSSCAFACRTRKHSFPLFWRIVDIEPSMSRLGGLVEASNGGGRGGA